MSQNLIQITDSNFETEVLQANSPVLLDFWAAWCGPCQAMGPIFEETAIDFDGKVKFGKVNVDENSAIATKYGIRSIPTLLLFKNGEIAATAVGATSKKDLVEFVDNQL